MFSSQYLFSNDFLKACSFSNLHDLDTGFTLFLYKVLSLHCVWSESNSIQCILKIFEFKITLKLQIKTKAHQTRRSGRLLHLGFNEVTQFLSKSEVLVALAVSLFKSVFFSPIIILFLQYSHKRRFLKCDPYRV